MPEFDEQIKLDNFEAHHEIILGNIQIANTELEKILVKKNNETEHLRGLKRQINALTSDLNSLLVRRDSVIKDIEERLASITEREAVFVSTETDSLDEMKRLKGESQVLTNTISTKTSQIQELDNYIEELNKTVDMLSSRVASLSETSKELSSEIIELDGNKALVEEDIKQVREAHEAEKLRLAKEIEAIQRTAEQERGKILDSQEFFDKKDKEYARRESDILVVTRRLKELFNEVKPGTALKI